MVLQTVYTQPEQLTGQDVAFGIAYLIIACIVSIIVALIAIWLVRKIGWFQRNHGIGRDIAFYALVSFVTALITFILSVIASLVASLL